MKPHGGRRCAAGVAAAATAVALAALAAPAEAHVGRGLRGGALVAEAPAPAPPAGVVPESVCLGSPPCSGRGGCDPKVGLCWCDAGFAGAACEEEAPETLDITSLAAQQYKEAVGRYRVDHMYLDESASVEGKIKIIHWERATSGWVISEFESPCQDDVCFFGYQQERGAPPTKGYVFNAPDFRVYYQPMVFDAADFDANMSHGYRLSVEYTPDPEATDVPDLTALNGRYVLQPRYVHEATGKYAIMPVDFKGKRTWVLAGLIGVPRKWHVLMKSFADQSDMYRPPTTDAAKYWLPLEYGMQVVPSCGDAMPTEACATMSQQCGVRSESTQWIRDCCRATCHLCSLSRLACKVSAEHPAGASLLQAFASRRAASALADAPAPSTLAKPSGALASPPMRRPSRRNSLRFLGFGAARAAQPDGDGDLSSALDAVLSGATVVTDPNAGSVWPAEVPDPSSGYQAPLRPTAAPPTIIERTIVKEIPVEVPVEVPIEVPIEVPGKVGPGGKCTCPGVVGGGGDAGGSVSQSTINIHCPPANCAAEAAAAAEAAQAANLAAQKAIAAAASMPSPEAIAAKHLAEYAAAMAGEAQDNVLRAQAASAGALHAVDQLRNDLATAAAARAAELNRVQVVPPTFR